MCGISARNLGRVRVWLRAWGRPCDLAEKPARSRRHAPLSDCGRLGADPEPARVARLTAQACFGRHAFEARSGKCAGRAVAQI